jgi:twitching motility protein PilT
VIQTGRKYGMQSLDNAIEDLLKKGWISAEEAYSRGIDKSKFATYLVHKPADGWE